MNFAIVSTPWEVPQMTADPSLPTVLVVDDEAHNREILSIQLEGLASVVVASDGAEALDAVESAEPDLVLLDVMMPGMDGFEVCRRIKATRSDHFLPVLLVTALTDQADRNRGLAAGADDFLSKPVDRRELQLRARAFLRLREQDRIIRAQMETLQRLQSFKDDLVALLVHDMRNSLLAIDGFLSLIRRRALAPELANVQRLSDLGLEAAQNLRRLVDDVLQVKLLEEAEIRAAFHPVCLDGLVSGAIETLAPVATNAEIPIVFERGLGFPVAVDAQLVRRAVENLLANALKYTPPRGAIEVRTFREDGHIVVEVVDGGPGVPDDQKETIFEKFSSVEGAKGAARRGHGLGLHFVRLVMEAHGGTASVRDREECGSAFRLAFPMTA